MEAFAKWTKTPEAKKAMEAAKSKAWKNFFAKFPNADKNKFEAQVYLENEKDHTGKGKIYFKKRSRFFSNCFWLRQQILEPRNESRSHETSAFPTQLTPIGGSSLPIPAVSFDSAAPSLKKIFNNSIDIYAKPDQYFTTKFREIPQKKTD